MGEEQVNVKVLWLLRRAMSRHVVSLIARMRNRSPERDTGLPRVKKQGAQLLPRMNTKWGLSLPQVLFFSSFFFFFAVLWLLEVCFWFFFPFESTLGQKPDL